MNITLFINSLRSGGAERVLSGLANHWAGQGHAVHLITLAEVHSDHYPLAAGIQRSSLLAGEVATNSVQALIHNTRRIMRLRRALQSQQTDCVVAFMTTSNVVALLAALGLDVPVIAAERSHPEYMRLPASRRWLQRLTYRWAYRVVAMSDVSAAWYTARFGCRSLAISNGISLPIAEFEPRISPDSIVAPDSKLVLSVGRLDPDKQMDHVLSAFDRAALGSDWHLVIIGAAGTASHEYAANLRATAAGLACAERVSFIERAGNIQQWYERASVFLFASRYEGFPNVLLEAMACGCATISYDCAGAATQIIDDQNNGILITDNQPASLCQALQKVSADATLRQRLGRAATGVLQTFSQQSTLQQWTELVETAAQPDT